MDECKPLVAGSSQTCSQKIFSMMAGIHAMAVDSEFVLFLDDDIRLHRSTIGQGPHIMPATS